jgi:hypothetical protein
MAFWAWGKSPSAFQRPDRRSALALFCLRASTQQVMPLLASASRTFRSSAAKSRQSRPVLLQMHCRFVHPYQHREDWASEQSMPAITTPGVTNPTAIQLLCAMLSSGGTSGAAARALSCNCAAPFCPSRLRLRCGAASRARGVRPGSPALR